MKKLFNFNKIPACEYCSFGRFSPDDAMILCIKKGIMMPGSSCSSFKYDVPKVKQKFSMTIPRTTFHFNSFP